MSDWDRGTANAQALNMGQLAGENANLAGANVNLQKQVNALIDVMGAEIGKQRRVLGEQRQEIEDQRQEIKKMKDDYDSYQDFLARKANDEDVSERFEIFAAVRPDLLPLDATIGQKRVANLKLFAWAEWFYQTLHGHARLSRNRSKTLREMAASLSKNHGVSNDPYVSAATLNGIAEHLEFAEEMENGSEWVDKRIHKMAENVKWKDGDRAIPIGGSIKQVVPILVDYPNRNKGSRFDPFEKNMYGINNIAAR